MHVQYSPCRVKVASNSSFWLKFLLYCAMTLYSHIQSSSKEIFCNSGFLMGAQLKQKILFHLTENTASVNPRVYGDRPSYSQQQP